MLCGLLPTGGLLGQDHPSPPEPRRRPGRQQRPVDDRHGRLSATSAPSATWPAAPPKASPSGRSSAVSSATSPARSTGTSPPRSSVDNPEEHLPEPRRPGPARPAGWRRGLAGPGGLCGRPTQPPCLRPPLPVGPAATWTPPPSCPRGWGRLERHHPHHRPPRWSSPPAAARGRYVRSALARSWPGSPPPRSATATASCGSRPATCTTWSPPAPSTTARSTTALQAAERCGLLAEEPRQTHRTLASARQVGLDHPGRPRQPPSPERTHPLPSRVGRTASGPRRGGDAHGRRRPAGRLTLFQGVGASPPSRARARPTTPQEGVPGWAATPP